MLEDRCRDVQLVNARDVKDIERCVAEVCVLPVQAAEAAVIQVGSAPGRWVKSADPATVNTPDGWTLTLRAKDETLIPVPPLI